MISTKKHDQMLNMDFFSWQNVKGFIHSLNIVQGGACLQWSQWSNEANAITGYIEKECGLLVHP